MSVESVPGSAEGDPSGEPKGPADATNKTKDEQVSRAELDKVIEERQAAKRKLREEADARKADGERHASELESYRAKEREFEEMKRKLEDDDAAKRLDFDAIRKSASEREAKLLADAKDREDKLTNSLREKESELSTVKHKWILESEVLRQLGEITIDAEASMLLIKDKLELGEDDNGRFVPRIKDSVLNVRDFVEKTFEESGRAYLLKNPRRAGTGAPQQEAGTTSSSSKSLSFEEIRALPDQGTKYFQEHPDAAKQFLESFKLGN